jgi:hypothetical protein
MLSKPQYVKRFKSWRRCIGFQQGDVSNFENSPKYRSQSLDGYRATCSIYMWEFADGEVAVSLHAGFRFGKAAYDRSHLALEERWD